MKCNIKIQTFDFKIVLVLLIIMILSILSKPGYGQIVERQLISATGNLSNSANLQVSATSGEIVVSTESSGTIILTQGFQQPAVEDFVGTFNIDDSDIEISIFPNPAISTLSLGMKSQNNIDLEIEILDITGKRVFPPRKISFTGEAKETLDFSKLPSNTYLILFKNKQGKTIQTFKIIKSRS